ncbi:TetR/AcrR family transcriptional regulator C-terminal domain-containing protein [Streptomyces chartreusis]
MDADQIIDAASRLDLATLTLRGVAKELGVDHKTLSHHIGDLDTLRVMLAWHAFSAHFAAATHPPGDWQASCREFASAFAESAIAVGPLAEHLTLTGTTLTRFIQYTEILIAELLEAGFDDEQALRLVVLLVNICLGHARDHVAASSSRARPRQDAVRRTLAQADAPALPNLERILSKQIDTYGEAQLEASVDVFLAGAQALLSRRTADHP